MKREFTELKNNLSTLFDALTGLSILFGIKRLCFVRVFFVNLVLKNCQDPENILG